MRVRDFRDEIRGGMGWIGAFVVAASLFGCAPPEKSSRGFHLPNGDVARGQQIFVELKCNACHVVKGVDLPAPVADPPVPVGLGGKLPSQVTDGELVTSIINPSHRLTRRRLPELQTTDESQMLAVQSGGQSRMADYNEVMTVEQLIDLVAFLHSRYTVDRPSGMK